MARGDMACKTCFGEGIVSTGDGKFSKCPDCLTVSMSELVKDKTIKINSNEVIDRLKEINAPEYVYETDFQYNGERLLRDRSISRSERTDVAMTTYVSELTELNELSNSGVKLPYSYLILSERGYSKTMAKWSIIKNYISQGFSVSKVLSTEDVINLKLKEDIKSIEEYDDYFSNDLVVLDLTGSVNNPRLNITCMVEVLEKCGRMNKPVICFGNFSKDNIIERGRNIERVFKKSALTRGKYDEFKVIEYVNPSNGEEFMSFKKNR